jgi:hypothetical protein
MIPPWKIVNCGISKTHHRDLAFPVKEWDFVHKLGNQLREESLPVISLDDQPKEKAWMALRRNKRGCVSS